MDLKVLLEAVLRHQTREVICVRWQSRILARWSNRRYKDIGKLYVEIERK